MMKPKKEIDIKSFNCLRCGRKLSNEESVERGYGTCCYKKVLKESALYTNLFDLFALKNRVRTDEDN